MLASLIIVFREAIEAGLIVGVVLAATRGVRNRGRWVALGISLGATGSGVLAFFAGKLASLFDGSGQELFNAFILFSAVLMLAWHNAWMASHGREMANEAKKLGSEVSRGAQSLAAVSGVIAIAVLREGSEVVLFLYGILASNGGSGANVALGAALGLVGGAGVSAILYFGLAAIPLRHFFFATSVMITLLAAGLASQAVAFLQQAGVSERWSMPLWNSSYLLSEGGWGGKTLHALVGYTDQPTGMQVVVYLMTLTFIFCLTRFTQNSTTVA
jgi:high-affinity iron transporter